MKQKFDIRTLEKSKLEASFNPPDNYVDNFTTRLMQQIPAEAVQPGTSSPVSPRRRLYLRLKVGLGVAAVMGGVAFCLFAGLRHHTPATQPQMSAQTAAAPSSSYNENYFDEVYTYAMLDDYDVYDYLAEDY